MPDGQSPLQEIFATQQAQLAAETEAEQLYFQQLWQYLWYNYVVKGAMSTAVAQQIMSQEWGLRHPTPGQPKQLSQSDQLALSLLQIRLEIAPTLEAKAPIQQQIDELTRAKALTPTLLHELPNFNRVRNWLSDLSEGVSTEAEAQRAQIAKDFTRQQAELAGWRATVTGQRQAVEAGRAEQRAGALARAFERPEQPIPPQAVGQPAMFEERFAGQLQGLPYTAQQYFGGRFGAIYDEFERAFPGARAAWWQALNARPEQPEGARLEQRIQQMRGELATSQQITAENVQRFPTMFGIGGELPIGEPITPEQSLAIAHARAAAELPLGIAGAERELGVLRERGEPEPTRRAPQRDPWEKYLETYPFMEKFLQVPRQYRGFFPRRFAPPARWSV